MAPARFTTIIYYGELVQAHTLVRAAKAHRRIAGGLEFSQDMRKGNRITTRLRAGIDSLPLELVSYIERQLRWSALNEVEAEFVKEWIDSAEPGETNKGCTCGRGSVDFFLDKLDKDVTYQMILDNCWTECSGRYGTFGYDYLDGPQDLINFLAFYGFELISLLLERDSRERNAVDYVDSYCPIGVAAPSTQPMSIEVSTSQVNYIPETCRCSALSIPDGKHPRFHDFVHLLKTYELTTKPKKHFYKFPAYDATITSSSLNGHGQETTSSPRAPKSDATLDLHENGRVADPCWRVWIEGSFV